MGKLTEALKKHIKAYNDHAAKPWIEIETDLAGHYEQLVTRTRLANKRLQAYRELRRAFNALEPQQRLDFFRQNVAPEKRQALAQRRFFDAIKEAEKREGGRRAFLTDDANFGRPWRELIPILQDIVGPEKANRVEARLKAGEGDEKRIELLYRQLADEQKSQFFADAVSPVRKQGWEEDYLEDKISRGSALSDFTKDSFYGGGRSWEQAMADLESRLQPQVVDELAARIDRIPDPEQGEKLVRPEQPRIDALRAQAGQDAKKLALLDRVSEILTYPTVDYVAYLNTRNTDKSNGADVMSNAIVKHDLNTFLQAPGNGNLAEKLPHYQSPGAKNPTYMPGEVVPFFREENAIKGSGLTLTEQEQNTLRSAGKGTAISPAVKQAVLDIAAGIDAIGEKNYWLPGVVDVTKGSVEDPKEVRYRSEQGDKKYAFWPLVMAKNRLRKAVQDGNWAEMETHAAEYERIKKITDKMLQDAHRTNPDPMMPENVNSTREELDHRSNNPMPTEYLEDYVGHTRVNGVFTLYSVCKNLGVRVQDMLDDPGKVFQDRGSAFSRNKLLDSHRNEKPGSRLAKALNVDLQLRTESEWGIDVAMLDGRAVNTIASFCPTAEERAKVVGMAYSALASTCYQVGQDVKCWRCMARGSAEKKEAIAGYAMLLSDEELDLKQIGAAMGRDDWDKVINPSAKIDALRKEGKLDYSALTQRAREMIRDAGDTENALRGGAQGERFYREAALRNFRQILRTAPAEERRTPGYKAMADYAAELQNGLLADKLEGAGNQFTAAHTQLKGFIRTLEKEKSGWLLSKTNSPEYEKMMKHLHRFDLKLDLLVGREPEDVPQDELEKLRSADPAELYRNAHFACMQYSKEKTNYGHDNILHIAGRERNRTAQNCAQLMGNMADAYDLRSPARSLMDKMELKLLNGRKSESWQARNAETCVAKYLCALSLEYKGLSQEKLERLLDYEHLNAAVEQMRKRPAFKQMMKNLGDNNLVGTLLRGPSGLTDAYREAEHQVKNPRQGPAPKITAEQKIEYWKDSPPKSL